MSDNINDLIEGIKDHLDHMGARKKTKKNIKHSGKRVLSLVEELPKNSSLGNNITNGDKNIYPENNNNIYPENNNEEPTPYDYKPVFGFFPENREQKKDDISGLYKLCTAQNEIPGILRDNYPAIFDACMGYFNNAINDELLSEGDLKIFQDLANDYENEKGVFINGSANMLIREGLENHFLTGIPENLTGIPENLINEEIYLPPDLDI